MRVLFLALLVVPATFTLGCTACTPEAIDVSVALDLVDEEVRALPILASGATQAARVDVPDSHGRFVWHASVTSPNVTRVDLDPLRIAVHVDGDAVPIQITRVEGLQYAQVDDQGQITGTLADGDTLVVWWTVDAGEDPAAAVLPEGAAYEVHVEAAWLVDTCDHEASGRLEQAHGDQVRAAVASSTFARDGQATTHDTAAGTGFQAPLRIKNGVDQRIEDGRAVLLRVATDGAPGIAVFEQVATKADGIQSSTVLAAQRLTVEDVTPRPFTPPVADARLDILVIVLEHHATDGTQGAETSVIGFVIPPTS